MDRNAKKVSIVIPTFNQAEYLPVCVDRCLFQTYPNLEIIIVDGGSTDGTKAYLKYLRNRVATETVHPVSHMDVAGEIVRVEARRYPPGRYIRTIYFERDIGATRTYNEGLKRVTGEYCTYVVGDDLPHPHMIEDLVQALEGSGADFVYSDMDLVDDEGRVIRQIRLPDYSFEACLADWYRLGVCHLYRTAWHRKVGLMDETYESANDYDHYLRFAIAGAGFHHLPRILYSVRNHDDRPGTGQHTPERYANLLDESKLCAFRARMHLLNSDLEKEPPSLSLRQGWNPIKRIVA